MRVATFFIAAAFVAVSSCTKDKTDYEASIDAEVPEYHEFKEAIAMHSGGYDIHIDALNGTLYTGYNEIRLSITNSVTGETADVSAATWLPIQTNTAGEHHSCPHRHELIHKPDDGYFSGHSVFTSESGSDGSWQVYVSFTIAGQTYTASQAVTVNEQGNKNLNMTAFMGKDDEQYVIALVSPQKPKIGENKLVAGIYKAIQHDGDALAGDFPDVAPFSYAEATGYTLLLDPRMPEPSMGNHSSPNNVDLTQQSDGWYHGVVNYTMTGNWTLNFIMLNQSGRILKGTEVPTDFTPGVEGVKSELHINVLF